MTHCALVLSYPESLIDNVAQDSYVMVLRSINICLSSIGTTFVETTRIIHLLAGFTLRYTDYVDTAHFDYSGHQQAPA